MFGRANTWAIYYGDEHVKRARFEAGNFRVNAYSTEIPPQPLEPLFPLASFDTIDDGFVLLLII
jgi:hypothetical protein